jgi:heme oxygenase
MRQLRAATRAEHIRLEALPFFTALGSGELRLVSYVGFLRALSVVYEAFERAVADARHPRLAAVWDDSLRKLPLIDQDLGYFQRYGVPQTPVAVVRASLVGQAVRRRAHDDPVSLLGYLYVLEGSTLGGLILRDQIARAFDLEGPGGLAYVSSYGAATVSRWRGFIRRMNGALVDPAEQERAVAAAAEAFAGVGRVVEALHPLGEQQPHELARELNPAAGAHAVTADPRELQAALRAGERSWREFPYYGLRYGERGVQFTRSDSAWIATLAEHEQPVVDQQVRWLGRVLASRGMPQWMLELHLEVLYEELAAALPERRDAYARLRRAAQALREDRQRYLSDGALAAHIAAFDARAGAEWSARLPRTGGLLAAAVAAEKGGLPQAVASIEGWMTDAARFPAEWAAAVRATIREAREQMAEL